MMALDAFGMRAIARDSSISRRARGAFGRG